MRRSWSLAAVLLFGAVSTASGQDHARLAARLDPGRPPGSNLIVSVVNLLDDPQWIDELNKAYVIHLHWRVTLWKSQFPFDTRQAPVEWDDFLQQVPVMDVFRYTERVPGRRDATLQFSTLDSLKAYAGGEVRPLMPRRLSPGKWYYTVDLTISIATDAEYGSRGGTDPGGFFQRLILGVGPSDVLPTATTAPFVVPNP